MSEEIKDTATAKVEHNLVRINTKQFEKHVRITMSIGGNLFIIGQRGFGKTSIIEAEVNKSEFKLIKINASVLDRTDMAGYPDLLSFKSDAESGFKTLKTGFAAKTAKTAKSKVATTTKKPKDMKVVEVDGVKIGFREGKNTGARYRYVDYILPAFMRPLIEGDDKVVVFFDELDKADQSILAPLLDFFQKREVNGVKLKNIQAIFAAGNLMAEGGGRPPPALLDRTEKYFLETNLGHFIEWGTTIKKLHTSIIAYLSKNGSDLTDILDPGDNFATRSPRSWELASDMMYACEALNVPSDILLQKVGGFLGHETAIKYDVYYKYYHELVPYVDEIMKGKFSLSEFEEKEQTSQLVCAMMVTSTLANAIDKSIDDHNKKGKKTEKPILPESLDHVGNFLSEIDSDIAYIAIRTQIGTSRMIGISIDRSTIWDKLVLKVTETLNKSEA